MSASSSNLHTITFATARALSPGLGFAAASSAASPEDKRAINDTVRRSTYEKAATVTDLVHLVPVNYRDVLGTVVREIAEQAEKLVNARANLKKLDASLKADDVPSHLKLKVPELQACKEFAKDGGLITANREIAEVVNAASRTLLETAIATKKLEIGVLEGLLERAKVFERMRNVVLPRWHEVRERSQIPLFKYVGEEAMSDAQQSVTAETARDLIITDWRVDPGVVQEFEDLIGDFNPLATRILTMAEAKGLVIQTKIEKKKAVVKSADVDMADLTRPGPSIQSLVDKTVQGKVKSLTAQIQKARVPYRARAQLTNALLALGQEQEGSRHSRQEGQVVNIDDEVRQAQRQGQGASSACRPDQVQQGQGRQGERQRERDFLRYAYGKRDMERLPPEILSQDGEPHCEERASSSRPRRCARRRDLEGSRVRIRAEHRNRFPSMSVSSECISF